MKRVITLFIAAGLMGFVIFCFMYWLLNKEFYFSVNVGMSGAMGGLAAELLRGYLEKRKRSKMTEVTKNKF
jgi:hypothetical protein